MLFLLFNNDKATTSTNKKKTKRQISKNEKNKIKLRIITRSHFPSCERKKRLSSSVDNGGVLIRKKSLSFFVLSSQQNLF